MRASRSAGSTSCTISNRRRASRATSLASEEPPLLTLAGCGCKPADCAGSTGAPSLVLHTSAFISPWSNRLAFDPALMGKRLGFGLDLRRVEVERRMERSLRSRIRSETPRGMSKRKQGANDAGDVESVTSVTDCDAARTKEHGNEGALVTAATGLCPGGFSIE